MRHVPSGAARRFAPWLALLLLPVIAHPAAVAGWIRTDPVYLLSGLAPGTWTTNGLLPGFPWIDLNAGVTTEALGARAAEDWLGGHVPWWNHFSGAGLPLAAEGQTPALFLPFVLLLALPGGLLLLRLALMAIAGVSSYTLLRRLALTETAAFAGAALFALNGAFAWLSHGPMMPVAFLPMTLLGLEMAREGRPWAAALGTAWTLLAGFPETAALNLILCACWGAVRLAQAERKLRYLLPASGSVLAGVLIATPAWATFLQALPFEFLQWHGAAIHAGLRRLDLPLMILPGIFGAPLSSQPLQGLVDAAWIRAGGYLGLLPLALASAALLQTKRERALCAVLALWTVLTMAKACKFPGLNWIFDAVPLLGQGNIYLYAVPGWCMVIAVLSAVLIDGWERNGVRPGRISLAAGLGLSCFALALSPPGLRELAHAGRLVPLATVAAVLLPLCGLAASAWVLARPPSSALRKLLLCALLVPALTAFIAPQMAGTRGRQLDQEAINVLRQETGLARAVSLGPLVPNYGAMFGVAQLDENALPVPSAWIDHVRHAYDPATDGVNVSAAALTNDGLKRALPGMEQDGAAIAAALPGERLDLLLPGATRFWTGETMAIWRLPHPAPYFSASDAMSTCRLISHSREIVTADCPEPAILHRLELYFPGWTATVNGAPALVQSGPGPFQSVALPAGHAEIRFAYAPPGLHWMLAASGAGVMMAVALLLWPARKTEPNG